MSLKLFRSTGYSSLLSPGESRVALHPAWLVAAVSAWIGLACNVALWRAVHGGGPQPTSLGWSLAAAAFTAGASAFLLGLLGWRRTLKPAATVLLCFAALVACGLWAQGAPIDGSLLARGWGGLLPAWSSLFGWQVPLLFAVLGLAPIVWVWSTPVRRLPGPQQLAINAAGMAVAALLLLASGWLLAR